MDGKFVTQTRWQAQKQGCIEGDKSTYGELRKYPELAIKDASEKSME
jgi:hypothetical protein|tara:strand:+ start:74 stop:214 length:141 start_codon:yes stop_codon:yes gene_type:complete